jgi:predicted MFS family arabinose efflux permease
LTSVFPYLPEMIQSFNVPPDQIAQWAGLTSAAFSLSQCLTAIAWGRASDRFGRKPAILLGLTCTMVTSVLFGLSKSLPWALVMRSLQGACNGNVGIIRTMVAELVPQKELQPRAFSVMPLVWTIGSILGPTFGGATVHPAERYPSLFGKSRFLQAFPFSPPNLLNAVLFLIGIVVGFLFLQESLETRRHKRDYGRMLGSALTRSCSRRKRSKPNWGLEADETEAFLSRNDGSGSELSSPVGKGQRSVPYKPVGYREVFSPQSNINLAAYTLLAMHAVAFDQLLPVFMHHPAQDIHSPDVHLPLKFAGGFGIGSGRIGVLFTIYGVYGMFTQFLAFPPLARRYGVLNCLKACSLTFPLIYLAVPFTSLLPTSALQQAAMVALMLMKGWCAVFAYPCTTILLTNSAVSLRILGTLNGVATSISAIGRAAGPALAGLTFTVGVDAGYVIVSFWMLAAVAILGAIPVFWLVEMEGFGGDEDDSDDSEAEDETEDDTIAETTATFPPTAAKTVPPVYSNEAALVDEPDEVPDDLLLVPTTPRSAQHRRSRSSLDLRRIPSPIGLGPQGVIPPGARRYSSDLGATRSGFGLIRTSYQ